MEQEYTYVWSEQKRPAISNCLDLLDEWASASNRYSYGERPYYFEDAEQEWTIAWM